VRSVVTTPDDKVQGVRVSFVKISNGDPVDRLTRVQLGHLDLADRDPIKPLAISSLLLALLLLPNGHVVWPLYPGEVNLVWKGTVVPLAMAERLVPVCSPRVECLQRSGSRSAVGPCMAQGGCG
jgi:hypothetical protein